MLHYLDMEVRTKNHTAKANNSFQKNWRIMCIGSKNINEFTYLRTGLIFSGLAQCHHCLYILAF